MTAAAELRRATVALALELPAAVHADYAPRVYALLDRIDAVRALHARQEFSGDGYGWTACAACRQCYPCPTIRALDGTS